MLHTHEVTGSNPVRPTLTAARPPSTLEAFAFWGTGKQSVNNPAPRHSPPPLRGAGLKRLLLPKSLRVAEAQPQQREHIRRVYGGVLDALQLMLKAGDA